MKGALLPQPCWFQLRRRMLLLEPLMSFKKDKERHCIEGCTSFFSFFPLLPTVGGCKPCIYLWIASLCLCLEEGKDLKAPTYFHFPCKFLQKLAFHWAFYINFCVGMSLSGAFCNWRCCKLLSPTSCAEVTWAKMAAQHPPEVRPRLSTEVDPEWAHWFHKNALRNIVWHGVSNWKTQITSTLFTCMHGKSTIDLFGVSKAKLGV